MEISNFYTATVYNKGAEVVRMIHTLLGAEGFRRGMDLYFKRHDGQAVCTEDFVAAMADAGSVDLGQVQRWYEQAGTPRVTVAASHDPAARTYTLDFTQSCPPTSGQPEKLPFHIPVSLGLLDRQGRELRLRLQGEVGAGGPSRVLSLTEASQRFVFEDVTEAVVPSLLRGFSAPVELAFDYPDDALAVLAAHDSDPFNRWEAGQRLAMRVIVQAVAAIRAGRAPQYGEAIINACRRVLADASRDPAFAAEALSLPGAAYIAEQLEEVDPEAILAARMGLRRVLATHLQTEFEAALATYTTHGPYSPDPISAGRRALRNLALGYLMELESPDIRERCLKQLREADNMTDSMAALLALANCDCAEREAGLEWFYTRWQAEPLVVDKWFSAQASSRLPGTLAEVKRLLTHPAFDLRNPNKVRALIGAFCHGNHVGFNAADGSGYAFAAEQIIALDGMNAQVAARMARAFDRWKKFDAGRQQYARTALERIRATEGLSKDSFEVVSRALA
jgi:aminopeptidase N